MESASRVKFRNQSKPFMLDRNAWHELKMRVNGTDFKAWLDGNPALEHTPTLAGSALAGAACNANASTAQAPITIHRLITISSPQQNRLQPSGSYERCQ